MVRSRVWVALAALTLTVPILGAQDKSKDTKASAVPESAMPPAGMCRLWLPDVPERQQPAPTDCATAIRTMPRDAMVLFGDLKRAAKQTTLSTAEEAAGRRQGAARDLPQYRGMSPAERAVQIETRASAALRGQGAQSTAIARGGSATQPAGGATAAAAKAPDTKAAAIVKPPEKPQ